MTWEEPGKPGRTLGTATRRTGIGAAVRDVCRPATGPPRSRADSGGRRGGYLYRSGRDLLRTAAGRGRRGRRTPGAGAGSGRPGGSGHRSRSTAEKQVRVCRHNGLFVAIPTVGENRDGIGHGMPYAGAVRRCRRLGVAVATQAGWTGRRRGRRSDRRQRPAPRCAAGTWARGGAATARSCARSARLERVRALPRKAHAAILLPPGPEGPAGAWRHTPSWQGRAVRGGSPRGGVSIGLRPLEPPRAQGARYALSGWPGARDREDEVVGEG